MSGVPRPHRRESLEQIANAFGPIRSDRSHGARALAGRALGALGRLSPNWTHRTEGELRCEFLALARALERAQPAMGPFLRWALDWRALARSSARGGRARAARSWIRRERSRLRAERAGIVRTSRRRFPPAAHVVTLSRSQSVLWALHAPVRSRAPARVSVLESLPGGEGRLFAKELRGTGMAATTIPDARGPETVARADLLLVGADAVLSDGSVVHKVGTRPLARAAFRAGVPVVVVAGRSKFVPGPPPRGRIPSTFDRTPARFILEFWTDRGTRVGGSRRGQRPRSTTL